MATIAATSENTTADRKRQRQERVAKLRRQLQEAEVEESMTEVVATMHVLHTGEENRTFLGPTLTTEVEFEGSPVRALLDTGSPVTIVSMEFLLRTLAKRRHVGQTTEEWEAAVKARFGTAKCHTPELWGKELNIVRQIEAGVARGDHRCEATILVQKHAPLDLLLGTDLQSKLGFFFMKASSEETVTDLLQQQRWKLSPTVFTRRQRCATTTIPIRERHRGGEYPNHCSPDQCYPSTSTPLQVCSSTCGRLQGQGSRYV